MRVNNFPENFIVTNPQFSNVFMIAGINSNNYHSMEAQVTMRETHGISMQSSYTWSKNLGISYAVGSTYTNAVDRHPDYALLPDTRIHDFRTNGSFSLPFGPNKLLFAGSSGVVARVLEDWKLGWILNVNSGQPVSISAQNMLYANGTADIVGDFDRKGTVEFKEGASSGTYFMGGELTQVRDPQCSNVTTVAEPPDPVHTERRDEQHRAGRPSEPASRTARVHRLPLGGIPGTLALRCKLEQVFQDQRKQESPVPVGRD